MSDCVRVMFFASLREEVGVNDVKVAARNTEELLTALAEQLSSQAMQALGAENVRIAVNQQLIEGTTELQPGDEVAFLPPVTGG